MSIVSSGIDNLNCKLVFYKILFSIVKQAENE